MPGGNGSGPRGRGQKGGLVPDPAAPAVALNVEQRPHTGSESRAKRIGAPSVGPT